MKRLDTKSDEMYASSYDSASTILLPGRRETDFDKIDVEVTSPRKSSLTRASRSGSTWGAKSF